MSEHRPPVRRRRVRLSLGAFVCILGLAPLLLVVNAVSGGSRLRYLVQGDRLTIETGDLLSPGRSVPLDGLVAAEAVQLGRGRRVFGTGFPGYCVGRFSYVGIGQVWQATNCSGSAVLVRLRDEPRPIVLTPADPTAFLAALRDRTPIDAPSAVASGHIAARRWVIISALALGFAAIAAAVALFISGPERLSYHVSRHELEIRTLFGRRRWPLAGVTARPHRIRLGLRLWGAGLPGYHTGLYLADSARTHVYATQREGVLLEGPARVFVSPAEVAPFLAELEREGVSVQR